MHENPASLVCGLTEAEAHRRLNEGGPNELPVSKPRSVLRLPGQVASEPMLLLLLACGAIYMALGDRHEALMLLLSLRRKLFENGFHGQADCSVRTVDI